MYGSTQKIVGQQNGPGRAEIVNNTSFAGPGMPLPPAVALVQFCERFQVLSAPPPPVQMSRPGCDVFVLTINVTMTVLVWAPSMPRTVSG